MTTKLLVVLAPTSQEMETIIRKQITYMNGAGFSLHLLSVGHDTRISGKDVDNLYAAVKPEEVLVFGEYITNGLNVALSVLSLIHKVRFIDYTEPDSPANLLVSLYGCAKSKYFPTGKWGRP